MSSILSAVLSQPLFLQTLGRFHVVLVHFPIALLLVAGLIELWRAIWRSDKPSPTALMCIVAGGISAIAAAGLGWIHKSFYGADGDVITHQWLGIAAAGTAVAAIVVLGLPNRRMAVASYRAVTLICAVLVALAGHYGGNITHGEGYLTALLFPKHQTKPAPADGSPKPLAVVMPVSFPTDGKINFARDVQPILQETCLDCHGPAKHRSDLRLDTREASLKGGKSGPAFVVGKSDESLMIKHVFALDGKKRMPMGRDPLTEPQEKILKAWVDQGANWPADASIASQDQKTHWAYVKPKHPELPAVNDRAWPKNGIDNFILARLEKEGLKPSPEADRTTLIRRLSLDLIGLPPTPEEVDAFVNDPSPGAYDALVNRLLSSPHYGERWGRHWLDLARYADTNGYEKDNPRVIWPYRDWVINAINRDMTFDQFVIDQMAGDMLPGATPEEKIATGFHRNTMFNEEGGIDVEEFRFKAIIDRVQTTSTALLGLTMHCAQCHNHKYDDISQKEYYKFFALFNNADEPYFDVPDAGVTEQRRQISERVATLKGELASKFPFYDDKIEWVVLKPTKFATSPAPTTTPATKPAKIAKLTLQPDNSLLASGKVNPKENYTIEAEVDLDGVSAFRLEALTDPSLPKQGPGRNKNGNFVLSQFKVEMVDVDAAPDAKPTRIKLDRAEADFNQPEFDVSKSLDEFFDKGWAINGGGTPRTATFFTPEKLAGKKKLIISLLQIYKEPYPLGKFRLSVGRAPKPPTTQPTPADRENFLAKKLDEWDKEMQTKSSHWEILDPQKYSRFHDATITKLDDHSLLYTGDNFYREEYKVQVATTQKSITAIRLEVLPDAHLPKGGPGRNPTGGFLLSEINAVASSTKTPATTQPVGFASATADASPETIARAIDGDKASHWTVAGGGMQRQAVFKLKDPIKGFEGGTTLDIALAQNYFQQENMGRIRISVTDDEKAGQATGLPADVEEIILTPKANRTAEQSARLREHYLSTSPYLTAPRQEIETAKASMPAYTTTLVMDERKTPRVTHLHNRGEFLQPKDPIGSAGVPAVLPQLPKGEPANRLTLAKWLVDPENPLVARVVMNRFWTLYFGRGIVNTIEDFGIMGERPSHPELLDYLATEFEQRNWSMKAMHRMIVTSATYRQASRLTPELKDKDPLNVLYARGPRFRVEAEVVRDIALASSGLLSQKIGGPSVFPPQPAGVSELSYGVLAWNTSPGADKYRRGMYTFLKRTQMYPMELTFDGPTAEVVCARRTRSNTPLQSLTTLNNQVFVEAAQALAKRVIEEAPNDEKSRAIECFRLCVARAPDATELQQIVDFYNSQLKRFRDNEKTIDASAIALASPSAKPLNVDLPELAAWTTVARSILNLDETVTKE